jgi:hypothetical protein
MSVLYSLNLDIDSFTKTVVGNLDAEDVADFVGSYAKQVSDAFSAGNSQNPQTLLLDLYNSIDDDEKKQAIIDGWRSQADSAELDSTGGSFDFGDDDTFEITSGSRRRLADAASKKITVNRFECKMIDTEILEGKCYEILIDGSVTTALDSPVTISYSMRDSKDTHCVRKESIVSTGWVETKAEDGNSACSFSNNKASITDRQFGVVSTNLVSDSTVQTKVDPKVLTGILVVAIVIFVMLFVGLAYALWVYTHPPEPVDVNKMWAGFDEERKKNLQEKREARFLRKMEIEDMEDDLDYSDSDSDSNSDSDSDGHNNTDSNDVYDDMMKPMTSESDSNSEGASGNYDSAINAANDASKFAQQAAENTDIVQEEEMEREEELGEVKPASADDDSKPSN